MTSNRNAMPIRRYRASADFVVQWQHDGDLRVLYAPMMEDTNPFFFRTQAGYIDIISAVDAVTNVFFGDVGRMYYDQYQAIPADRRAAVVFPPVRFKVSVSCQVNLQTKIILSGRASAEGDVRDLQANVRRIRHGITIQNLWASVYRVDAVHTPASDCLEGLEIQGHPDPNCRWRWFQCVCVAQPCCQHIVQPLFGNPGRLCYDETCAWGWLWLACGCHKKNVVPCPDCKAPRMDEWVRQLREVGLEFPNIL